MTGPPGPYLVVLAGGFLGFLRPPGTPQLVEPETICPCCEVLEEKPWKTC
nr:MAG TPA_asm: hypothetical protein [Caudoviricetes sp.]